MDHYSQLDDLLQRLPPVHTTVPSLLAYAIGGIFFLHQVLVYLDYAILSPLEITWNAIVYLTPLVLVLDKEKRKELQSKETTWSQTHTEKSQALRSMLGLGGRAAMQQIPAGANLVRNIGAAKVKPKSDAPPGLGNWDNSCYQNSVLQGLSAVESLEPYLSAFSSHDSLPKDSTSSSLQQIVQKLNNATHNGSHIWTPAKLKSMSSWQQQDAQEYYSKIVDDLEKEASKVFGAAAVKPGLEDADKKKGDLAAQMAAPPFSVPLEGLLAQRVACTRCGFSEGLSMIPFNCLTVPLGSGYEYDLSQCLDEYTHIEDIAEVECAKCTLLKAKTDMNKMLLPPVANEGQPATEEKKVLQLPPELREKITDRLRAVTEALEADDFSDKTLKEVCQISKKARVSSTKTRQAVIGRAPRSLVVHVNRSVFDEMTGAQKKNYAAVRYPQVLDLGKWMLGPKETANQENSAADNAISEASQSMLVNRSGSDQCLYRLKAVITHYGRHENGHYIAYRQHPPAEHATEETEETEDSEAAPDAEDSPIANDGKLPWWRLSDEDVSSVPDEDVLKQGGVFMLFYERQDAATEASTVNATQDQKAAAIAETPGVEELGNVKEPIVVDTPESNEISMDVTKDGIAAAAVAPNHTSEPSTGTTTEEEESEADTEDQPHGTVKAVPKATSPPPMRTARTNSAQSESGFPSPNRIIAAT
ncbi:hypothetical protein Q7P37_002129 [Cladosporium fusiforme]